jgi:hypothetical protein
MMSLKFNETTTIKETLCPRATLEATTESGIVSHGTSALPEIHAVTTAGVFGPDIVPTSTTNTAIQAFELEKVVESSMDNPLADAIQESRREAVAATLLGHYSLNCVSCPQKQSCIPYSRISRISSNYS